MSQIHKKIDFKTIQKRNYFEIENTIPFKVFLIKKTFGFYSICAMFQIKNKTLGLYYKPNKKNGFVLLFREH